MFNNQKTFKTQFAGRELSVETGKTCELSNGSCWVRYGDTVVMANVAASVKPRDGVDFFPLSVEFEEKLYSVGKIPGGFLKREGKPSEKAVLTSRVVDRPIRPLFPKDMRNDVALTMTVLSADADASAEIIGMIAASIAISISDIPWNGPIGGISVGLVGGKIVLMPTAEQRAVSDLNLTVASSATKVVMIEAGAKEVDDDTMLSAIAAGHKEVSEKIVPFIEDIKSQIGKTKFEFISQEVPQDLFDEIYESVDEQVKHALDTNDKNVREERLQPIKDDIHELYKEKLGDAYSETLIEEIIYKIQKKIVRDWLVQGKRVDGRKLDELRPLAAEVSLLPRVHGTGLFTRGQTQVLTVATLGPVSDSQRLEGLEDSESKRFMHHYNFPPYSVGEAKTSRGPGRREIGHGALAERALEAVMPSVEEFPYAVRLVSEILSSNGSTSQASICGSTLALMDAGVPITAPVAGISCGLISNPDGSFKTMIDIQGVEDFYGDMDFKVGGTHKGITAIQMDLKIDGLTPEIIEEAIRSTHKARIYILDEIMLKAIPESREKVGEYAPKMHTVKIPPEKIGEVVGKGGKVIQKLCLDFEAKIDIEDDGNVFVCGTSEAKVKAAIETIKGIVTSAEIGSIYKGRVTRVIGYGAFVEFLPGKEGMVHISELDNRRVESVESVCNVGDMIVVKIIKIDPRDGKIGLSRRAALADIEDKKNAQANSPK